MLRLRPPFRSRVRGSGVIPERWPSPPSFPLLNGAALWSNLQVDFANASAAVLANRGISLGQPQSASAISEEQASAIARDAAGGAVVLESHYGYCRMVSKNPPVAQDCWAFSLDPRGLASTGGIPAEYFLVVVDASSGEVLSRSWGAAGRDPSSLPRDPRLGSA
jgi:hypothetical protein